MKINKQAFGASFGGNSLQSTNKGKWYFYNSQSLNFGKSEFKKTWGTRTLEDDWRWSSKMSSNSTEKNTLQVPLKNSRYDLMSYLKTIPTDKKVIDTLILDRNDALYELGIIYKEQFKDTKLAIERLERVAELNPKKELILPINWHLHKLYSGLRDETKANKHKKIILSKYPKTKFATVSSNLFSLYT